MTAVGRLLLLAAVALATALALVGGAPAAEGTNTVVAGNARFQIVTPTLIRLEHASNGSFEDRPSLNATDRDHGPVAFTKTVDGDTVTLRTSALTLTYTGPGAFDADNVKVTLRVGDQERTVSPAFDGRTAFPTPVYQVPEPDPDPKPRTSGNVGGWYRGLDQARGPVRLHDGLISRDGFYLLDDSTTALLTDGSPGYATRPAPPPGGTYQDGYLFGYGHDYARGLADLRALTGAAPLLPRKAFGNWFSRYANFSDEEYREAILPRFRAERVPLDVLVVDTDFKEPKAWNGWSWRDALFGDPPGFIRWAHGEGLDVSLNIHPSISTGDPKHAEANATAGGLDLDPTPRCETFTADPSNADCRTFDWADPLHVKAYFDLHAPFEADGNDMWWLDWCCDESKVTAAGLTGDTWINELYNRRSVARGKRWPVMSRVGAAFDQYGTEGEGIWAEHRNTLHFTGDAFDTWETLDFQTLFNAAEGNVGIPYVSHDIGSFHGGKLADDLYVRWIQSGVFSSINRLHSSKREGARLPWEYEGKAREVAAELLRLRGRLVPFLYTLARASHDTGLPMTRGTYLAYPEHDGAYEHDRQYLLGEDVLVAPVGTAGDPATKRVWFPPGAWTDLFTGEVHRGPAAKDLEVPLERMPVFVKAGGIVPMQEAVERAGTAPPDALALRVQAGGDGQFDLYDDEGDGLGYREGRFARTLLRWSESARTLTVGAARGTFPGQPASRSYRASIVGVDRPTVVTVAGRAVTDWEYDAGRRTLTVATGPRPVGEETAIVLATGRPVATDSPRAETAPRCLARRARVTRRGIGRVRLRATRASLRRAGVAAPRRASRTRLAFCVRGGGRVVAALDRRGRIRLVATTARGHRRGRLHPRARATVLRRVHPGRAVRGRGVVAASRRSRILFGVSRRRVSFVAVSASARPKLQRALLRRARLRR